MGTYSNAFFSQRMPLAISSAKRVIPLLDDLVSPRSVIDHGCGTGTWLAEFRSMGVEDIVGLDGDYVDRQLLEIPEQCFMSADLEQPLKFDRTFDLAISLEVGEHLRPSSARQFVRNIVSTSSIVAFSAAIPGQGGVNHVNEHWPEYWSALFAEVGYECFDIIRCRIWQDSSVAWWYRQNMFIFANADGRPRLPNGSLSTDRPLSLVHPELLASTIRRASLSSQLRATFTSSVRSIVPSRVRPILKRVTTRS